MAEPALQDPVMEVLGLLWREANAARPDWTECYAVFAQQHRVLTLIDGLFVGEQLHPMFLGTQEKVPLWALLDRWWTESAAAGQAVWETMTLGLNRQGNFNAVFGYPGDETAAQWDPDRHEAGPLLDRARAELGLR